MYWLVVDVKAHEVRQRNCGAREGVVVGRGMRDSLSRGILREREREGNGGGGRCIKPNCSNDFHIRDVQSDLISPWYLSE